MFYVNVRRRGERVKQKQLSESLLIPCGERTTKDHQCIYRFFWENEMLVQMERVKSLNARIKCVAALSIVDGEQIVEDHMVMYRFEDNRVVVLSKEIKQKAQSFNQKDIRKKMDELSQFSVMKLLKYEELLYLAVHMETTECKYKESLYRQGEEAEFVYLIAVGEFYYVRESCEGKQKAVNVNNKKDKKRLGLKSDQGEEEDSPNKQAKVQVSRYKVGIVSGGQGQSVGFEEIVLSGQRERRYSVICDSTQNRVIRIHRRYLEEIFQELPEYLEQLQKLVAEANQAKQDLFRRIKTTQMNFKQSLMNQQAKVKEKGQSDSNELLGGVSKLIKKQSVNRYQLPSIDQKAVSFEYRSKAFSSALTMSLQGEDQRMRSMKSQTSMRVEAQEEGEEQGEASFAITGLAEEYPIKSKLASKLIQNQQGQVKQSKEQPVYTAITQLPMLPKIGSKVSIASVNGDFLGGKSSEMMYRSRSKSKVSGYAGLIDSSQLVRDLQNIMHRKVTRQTRKDLFPVGHIEYKALRSRQIEDPMKLKASPAHSNRFMEKLLLKVLKKAGYDEEITTVKAKVENKTVNVKNSPYLQFHGSGSRNRGNVCEKKERSNESRLLVDRAFDNCYFSKI